MKERETREKEDLLMMILIEFSCSCSFFWLLGGFLCLFDCFDRFGVLLSSSLLVVRIEKV